MKKIFNYSILFLLALGIIVYIFSKIGFAKIWHNIQQAGWSGFGLFLAASVLSLIITGFGWWLILRSYKIKVSIIHSMIGNFIAYGISLFIPSFYVGGEPFRAYYLGKKYNISKTRVFATGIYSKFMELIAFIIFLYFGTLVLAIVPECRNVISPTAYHLIISADILLTGVLITLFWSVTRKVCIFAKLVRFVGRMGFFKKYIQIAADKVQHAEELISEVFSHNWKLGIGVLFLSIISVGITFFKPIFIFWFMKSSGSSIGLAELAIIFTVGQILLSFHLTPGGMGFWEGGLLIMLAQIGVADQAIAAFMILARLVDFILTGLGVYLILHFRLVSIHIDSKIPKMHVDDLDDVKETLEKKTTS